MRPLEEEGLLSKRMSEEGETYEEARAKLSALSAAWRKKAAAAAARRLRWRFWRRAPAEEGEVLRRRAAAALESTLAHFLILSLLLIDLLATCIDLLHTLHTKSRDLAACRSLLQSCDCSAAAAASAESPPDSAPIWEALPWVGVSVLCALLAYLVALAVSLGPHDFFCHPGYVLDAIVLTTALFLELCLDTRTAGLLVILNLWRIVRVAHGVFEFTDEAWEKNVERLQERIRSMDEAHRREVGGLRERCRELGKQLVEKQKMEGTGGSGGVQEGVMAMKKP